MADREPIVNIFGITGPSGFPVQSPATLALKNDSRWNSFLQQYAVWPTSSNAAGKYIINRVFNAPYTGQYYLRASVDNYAEVYINDLRVGGVTQTIEHWYWWWWWGYYGWGGYNYPYIYGNPGYYTGYYGYWWGHPRLVQDFSVAPQPQLINLQKGVNQLRFEVVQQNDNCGFGATISNSSDVLLWDTRSTASVTEWTQTCGRYTLTAPTTGDCVAYIWGGGGGGGGNDSASRGGDGAPGKFHKVNFSINQGDLLEIVVGDGGQAGGSSAGSAAGGNGGASRINLAGFGSFSGARGANAGPGGSSGGGGGGGGASLVILNGIPIGVAGGGAGGGGAGNDGNSEALYRIRNAVTAYPDAAQIYSGASAVSLSGNIEPMNGQRGQGVTGDGGGGGGGGGGWGGGSGGTVRGGDSSAYGGQSGGVYPFNQIFKHTAGNVSFVVPANVTSVDLRLAIAGGGGGGSGNLTLGGGGGGQGARAENMTITVVPGRLYEISVGAGGRGGRTSTGAYSGVGTLSEANLTYVAAEPGGITSVRDTVTDTYLLKLGGGTAGNLVTNGTGGTVITNLGTGGTTTAGQAGSTSNSAQGGRGGGPTAGTTGGADATTNSDEGSDFGCGSAGAGSNRGQVFANDPTDQSRPQTLSSLVGGAGANGAILLTWDEDQRLNEDGELITVSDNAWGSFLNNYGMWTKVDEQVITVTRTFFASYSGTYTIRAAATGNLTVSVDEVVAVNVSNNFAQDPAPVILNLFKGPHQIKFNVTSTSVKKGFAVALADNVDKVYWDTRDSVFTNPPGQNMRYYVPPYARGGVAGQEGSNGAVALEFYPLGLGTVKVDNQWRSVGDGYVKIGGAWRSIDAAYIKTNNQWKALAASTDLDSLIFTQQFTNYGVSDRTGLPPGPGGTRGGRGCKIICQKLAELGYFDSAMNKADQQFGIALRDNDPDAYHGYIKWAGPVVDLLEGGGSATFRKIVFPWIRDEKQRQDLQIKIVAYYLDVIARPWAEEMAFRMNAEGYTKSNPAGKFIMNIGLPMCRIISKFNTRRKLPMWAKTAAIWATTTILLSAVTIISGTNKIVNLFRWK